MSQRTVANRPSRDPIEAIFKIPGRTLGAFNVFSTPYHELRQGYVPVLTPQPL